MTKVAIYGFIRIVFDLLGPPEFWWCMPPLALGAITAMLGILSATIQSDLKKLLAYSTIENIGIIFVALGLALAFKSNGMALPAALAFTAALFHVFNHSLFKSLLFFGAGAVLNATGERDIERLGGLIHSMPRTAFLFLGACVAISALPPLNGFVSEWLVFQAILLSPSLPQWSLKLLVPAVGVALALSAALCAGCFVRAFGIAFLGRARSIAAKSAQETDLWSLAAMSGLLALCLLAGLIPSYLIDTITPAAKAVRWRPYADPRRHSLAVDRADRREPQLLQRPAGLSLHRFFRIFRRLDRSRIRVERLTARPSMGLRLSRPKPRDPIHRQQFRSAHPPNLGQCRICRARPSGYAGAWRQSRPARFGVEIHDRVWDDIYTPILRAVDFCAGQLDRTHFLTIQGYLGLVFVTLVALLLVIAIWP